MLVRPSDPNPVVTGVRSGNTMIFRNDGNVSVAGFVGVGQNRVNFELDADVERMLRAQVLAAIADLPEVVSLRAEFAAYRAGYDREVRDGLPSWKTYRDEHLVVTRWDEVGGGRSFVNVELGDGGEACGDMFAGQRFLLFALKGGALVQQPGAGFKRPQALMDLERDGTLEAVTLGGGRLGGAADEAVVQRFEIPYHGCPC